MLTGKRIMIFFFFFFLSAETTSCWLPYYIIPFSDAQTVLACVRAFMQVRVCLFDLSVCIVKFSPLTDRKVGGGGGA